MSEQDRNGMPLPWNRESERAILGTALLFGAQGYESAKPLNASDFFDRVHGEIYSCMTRMVAMGRPLDPITLFDSLQTVGRSQDLGGVAYFAELAQCVSSVRGAGIHAKIVRQHAARRRLIDLAHEAVAIAIEPTGEVGEKLDSITTAFMSLQGEQVTRSPRSLADLVLARTDQYKLVQEGKVAPGWQTSIPTFNQYLGNGWKPGRLFILAARPAIGKSSLAESFALEQGRSGRKVLILSQEMTSDEVADRAVSNVCHVPHSSLATGRMSVDDWSRTSHSLDSLDFKNVYIDDQGGLTLMDIRTKAKQIPGLSMVIVDYLQLCAGGNDRNANRNSEIEQISRGLKALAKELGIVVIALSQLNRQIENRANKRPTLADLRDSGAIEQDADVVIFLWPVRDLSDGRTLVGLSVEKNRHGKRGDVALRFDGSTQRWEECDESLFIPTAAINARRGMNFDD